MPAEPPPITRTSKKLSELRTAVWGCLIACCELSLIVASSITGVYTAASPRSTHPGLPNDGIRIPVRADACRPPALAVVSAWPVRAPASYGHVLQARTESALRVCLRTVGSVEPAC